MIPAHVIGALREFGRSAGLGNFAFGARDSAALRIENGASLRFEYFADVLTVAMTVPCQEDAATVRKILSYSRPTARGAGYALRSGYLRKAQAAVFAYRIPGDAVTLPALDAAFSGLWQIAMVDFEV